MVEFIDSKYLLPSHTSGFRKGDSTTTALLKIRDDIIKAMNRGEVTIMVFADFSKAFDTVHFDIIMKLHSMGFSAQFLRWIMSYLTEKQQYVQTDDKRSGNKIQILVSHRVQSWDPFCLTFMSLTPQTTWVLCVPTTNMCKAKKSSNGSKSNERLTQESGMLVLITRSQTKIACDLNKCTIDNDNEPWMLFQGCWHSFHEQCRDDSSFCPICKKH